MWELILSYMFPQTQGLMPGMPWGMIPSLLGEVVPRPTTINGFTINGLGVAVAFRARTKNGAATKAQNAFGSMGWAGGPGSALSCLAIAADAALRESTPGRMMVPMRGGMNLPGMRFNLALPPGCSFQWRYVSPTTRQTPARASLAAQPSFMSRVFTTLGIGAKKSGACCKGCEEGTGCADPSTGCTGACMTSTGCDCKKKKSQTTVGACLSYLYGTGCAPKPAQITGYQTGGGCGGGGCGGGGYRGYGGYGGYGGCGYSTPCNIGCGSTAGCGSSGCGPGGCGNCGSGSVGCSPCLLGGWG